MIAVLLLASCSKIPENTDPVLGIWYKTSIPSGESQEEITKEEWIFNDVYLGRYQVYSNNSVTFFTDFQWEKNDGIYIISYPGTEIPEQNARMIMMNEQEVLQDVQGDVLAIRQ